jgi:hypothetical protein
LQDAQRSAANAILRAAGRPEIDGMLEALRLWTRRIDIGRAAA